MKIAITGATGFIGQKLVSAHLTIGDEVSYLTRINNKLIHGAKAFTADVNSPLENLSPFFEHVDILYHCAGELNDESIMRATHVQGTQNLLNALLQSRLQSKIDFHWIQLSSCGAYGQPTEHAAIPRYVDETIQDNPKGEYECTKTESDRLVIDFAEKHHWFKYTIIRPTIVFGTGMRSTAIVRIVQIVKRGLFFYVGNKNSIANYVHVDDVVSAMMLSVKHPHASNQIFIVANDCKLSVVIETIADCLYIPKPTRVINAYLLRKFVAIAGIVVKLPISNTQIDVMMRQTHFSSQKIKSKLNWMPHDSILKQLETYVKAVLVSSND